MAMAVGSCRQYACRTAGPTPGQQAKASSDHHRYLLAPLSLRVPCSAVHCVHGPCWSKLALWKASANSCHACVKCLVVQGVLRMRNSLAPPSCVASKLAACPPASLPPANAAATAAPIASAYPTSHRADACCMSRAFAAGRWSACCGWSSA